MSHEKKGLCFYYMETDKSWSQHIQTAAGASGQKSGGGNFYPPRSVYLTDKVNITVLDTSLLQISHLGTDTVNRRHFVLESGRRGRSRRSLVWCRPSFLPSPLLNLLPLSFLVFLGLLAPSLFPVSLFLIFLSVINLYLTDSILLYPAHIFFHLPRCLSPSSIALSPDAQEPVNWLQEHELDV